MNSSQIHLGLTHVPVILSIVGLVILTIGMIRKKDTLHKTAFYLLLFAGIFAIPVFLTGEGAEETVEHLPGVSEDAIERHEGLAKLAFGIVSAVAVVSLTALLFYHKTRLLRFVKPLLLMLGLATAGIMAVTAHTGGLVRHPEMRSDFTTQPDDGASGDLRIGHNEDKD
jgi:uncharacterized membrane protein